MDYHACMNLRHEFLPPVLDLELIGQVAHLAQQLQDAPERPDCPLLEAFNRLTGQQYVHAHFRGISGALDAHDFAEIALSPVRCFPDVQDSEFLEIIAFLLEGRGTERELAYWLEFLHLHLPHPAPADLIFFDALPAPEVLERLKNHRPLEG